jgi:hypothetical protein
LPVTWSPTATSPLGIRVVVNIRNPGSGESTLAPGLASALGPEWKVIPHDRWIKNPDVNMTGAPWLDAGPEYGRRAGKLIATELNSGARGMIFEGALVNDAEVGHLLKAAGLDGGAAGRRLVFALSCSVELTFARAKRRVVDFVRREQCRTLDDFRRGFYERFGATSGNGNLTFEGPDTASPDVINTIVERIGGGAFQFAST